MILSLLLTTLLIQQPKVWISDAQMARLPTSGPEWNALKADADLLKASPELTIVDQDDKYDSYAMAAAMVWKKTGDNSYRQAVETALLGCIGTEHDTFPGENNSSLELSRNLCSIAIAAEMIDWSNPGDEAVFKNWIDRVRFVVRSGKSIVSTHEERPNNWGTHAGASRVAIAVYLQDQAEIARCAQVFKGWLGDRSSYSGFDYGELSWQVNPNAPVGVNPLHRILGGALPEEQRRCGDYPSDLGCQSNYAWEAMQGVLAQAIILKGQGYDVWRWERYAIGRAAYWLTYMNNQPPNASVNGSDDKWQAWVLNKIYPILALQQVTPAPPGKHVGYTNWTILAGNWPRP